MTEHPTKGMFDQTRAEWRSAPDSNVEIAFVDDLIGMRDGRQPDGPILVFTEAEWEAFVLGAKDGEFDPEAFEEDLRRQEAELAGERARAAQQAEELQEGE
ncbi:DUF397 domain-containing protein [Flindersiella endophytica]